MINEKYIKQKLTKEKASKIIITTIITYILSILGMIFILPELTKLEYVSSTIAMLIFIMFIFNIIGPFIIGWLIFIIKSINKGTRLRRTEKGNELLEKIYGLKNFLKDFTNIDDVKLQELKLREHYLIYAVIFDINNNAENEMLQKIKKHVNKVN